jgi:hypothetical protein
MPKAKGQIKDKAKAKVQTETKLLLHLFYSSQI